ncbi:MAG: metallophosphoesterase family protein [Anaerolineaceae bacterium]|nr:metallophosphoesterase family protein [Anaerolineae bacterium]MCB9458416.1 metallophosphoesterase family protein [Anaerolineaceae bacterium]
MRLAILSDVHGNVLALEKVLAHLSGYAPDQIVCLGDVAANGARPQEALHRIRDLSCPVIMGNMDAFVLNTSLYDKPNGVSAYYHETSIWAAERLNADDKAYIAGFTPHLSIYEYGMRVLCYHGSPRNFDEGIAIDTPDSQLKDMLGDFDAHVYIGGHTHAQMLRRWGDKTIINPGSVGLAWEPDPEGHRPVSYAEYALLDLHRSKDVNVQFFRLPYDAKSYHQQMRDVGLPNAEWLIERWSTS